MKYEWYYSDNNKGTADSYDEAYVLLKTQLKRNGENLDDYIERESPDGDTHYFYSPDLSDEDASGSTISPLAIPVAGEGRSLNLTHPRVLQEEIEKDDGAYTYQITEAEEE